MRKAVRRDFLRAVWGFLQGALKMRNTTAITQTKRRFPGAAIAAGALVAHLLLGGAAMLPMTGASEALPRTCVIRSYYNNAELDTQVGMRSSCPGARKWGKTSRFVEVETVDLVPDGPSGPGGGPGSLPCEFLASGCSNLPELRHN
jgi:hypothetical protein